MARYIYRAYSLAPYVLVLLVLITLLVRLD
jgi:hypothetical protein